MNIRPFGLRDLPLLPKYHNRGLYLDSTRVLIHGSIMVPMGALISFVGPTLRIFSYYCENASSSHEPIIGQVTYSIGTPFARFSFLAPEDGLDQPELSGLAEYIVADIGQLGIFHMLADVDEASPVFHLIHRAGFATYARQRIWRLDGEPQGEMNTAPWRSSRSRDAISIRSLYCNVVPGLVQQVEPLPQKDLKGVVYYQNSELLAFIELKYGRKGIWVQPFVNPDTAGFGHSLAHLLYDLPGRRDRPLYICVRSYQSWLDEAVEAMGAKPGPQQAVMVRHLAVSRRVNQALPLPTINGKRVEPTAPLLRSEQGAVLKPTKMENKPG
jgi:hypothetical protein